MVEIDFHTSLELRRAHYAIQALAHEYSAKRQVWLATAKTVDELRSGRVTRRLVVALQEIGAAQQEPRKDISSRRNNELLLDGANAGFVSNRGEVLFKQPLTERYAASELAMIKAWTESS